jgi:uncharacterized protein YbjT (DUF2867 family)
VAEGFAVQALVRDPASPAAAALAKLGIRMIAGELDDEAALVAGCSGASSMFVALPAARGTSMEMQRARCLARTAIEAGVRQAVYSTVSGTGWRDRGEYLYPEPDANYWDNKEAGEAAFRGTGFDCLTILKPAILMEDFLPPKSYALFAELAQGHIAMAIAPTRRIALIAADDLASATVAALRDPDAFNGAEIEMAGDLLTMAEIAAAISAATGKEVTWETIRPDEVLPRGQNPALLHSYRLLDGVGYPARPHHAERHGLQQTSFGKWAVDNAAALKALIQR